MVNPIMIEKARAGKRRALDAVYALLVVNEPSLTTDPELAHTTGIPKQDIQNLRYDLTRIGVLQTQRAMEGKQVKSRWMLTDTLDVARDKLNRQWQKDDRTTTQRMAAIHHPKGARASNGSNGLGGATPDHPVVPDLLVHASGPESSKPMGSLSGQRYDEPAALVEAARQYAGIHKEVDKRFKELESLGVHIDREKIAKGMTLPADPRLSAVADALPYIEHLERQVERLTTQNTDLKEKVADLPRTMSDVQRIRNQNERLIAENTGLRQQLSNQDRPERRPKDDAPSATT